MQAMTQKIQNTSKKKSEHQLLNDVYYVHADIMNINKPMEQVVENNKLSVLRAFTDHKDNYGLDFVYHVVSVVLWTWLVL